MCGKQFQLNRRQFLKSTGGIAAAATIGIPRIRHARQEQPAVLTEGTPEDVGMSSGLLEDVFARIQRRITDGYFPGAVALIARRGVIVGHRAFGVRLKDTEEAMQPDTIFDLESMTKVMATATTAMLLVQQGKLNLEDTVATHLPEFAANGKENIMVRDMLRYSAGLPIDNPKVDTEDKEAIWKFMAETALEYEPGTMVEYSDLTYRLLGHMLEMVAGTDLNTFAKENIWSPLDMEDTMYNPPEDLNPRIASTGPGSYGLREEVQVGEVQDDQDWRLGGIVGCDGVFSTAKDIAVFCQMFLNGGSYNGTEILTPENAAEMVKNQTPQVTETDTDLDPATNLILTPKGYGWELWTRRFSSGGTRLSPGSYGKAGGAGTFMWIDPERELFGVYLTNHGLPIPFDIPGWNGMLDRIGVYEFFDGMVNAVVE